MPALWQFKLIHRFRYLGDRKFVAVETLNSKIRPGDTFYCSSFIKGRKLYVDNLEHKGTLFESYGMGTEHGLTRVTLEKQ